MSINNYTQVQIELSSFYSEFNLLKKTNPSPYINIIGDALERYKTKVMKAGEFVDINKYMKESQLFECY